MAAENSLDRFEWKLCTCIRKLLHILGALAHTQSPTKGKLSFGYYDLLQYPHTANITIDVLMRVIIEVHTLLKCIPEILYIQLDNCCKENKNKFFLVFVHCW